MSIVKNRRTSLRVDRAVFVGLLVLSQVAAATKAQAAAKTIRVLFIGNSLTYFNDLPAQLQALTSEAYSSGASLRYESITPGGCTLQKHWNDGQAAAQIAQGHWDYVVLQEQSQIPFSDRQQMYHYARLFDHEIKKVGAKTVLYMTFPLKKRFVHGDEMPEIYTTLGEELRAIIVPVDVASHEAAKLDPELALYRADGVHPSPAGTYLAACCFAQKLWGEPARPFSARLVRANSNGKPLVELGERHARELQRAAAIAVSSAASAARQPGSAAALPTVEPARSDGKWVDLFNGKDLKGWADPHGLWKVKDRILVGSGGKGYLDTTRANFANFHIRVVAIVNDGGNSGLVFRAQPGACYEAQIEANGVDEAKTGSLYVFDGTHYVARVQLSKSPAPANEWFTMEVVAAEFHISILVNGQIVAEYDDDERIASTGRIRLQVGNSQTLVKFREVQIRELGPSKK
jgi:hypothetical protein